MRAAALGIGIGLCLAAAPALGADFYVDPVNGSMQNDGSEAKPWRTLPEVIAAGLVESRAWSALPYDATRTLVPKNAGAPVRGGDTVWLRSGDHGALDITGYYNELPITIAADAGQEPRFSNVLVRASSGWVLSGLHVSPQFAATYDRRTMLDLDSHGYQGPVSDIVVERCVLLSVNDASAWSAADWDTLSANGIQADGKNITLRENQLRNVNFGISVGATDSLVEGNVIDGFAGDGLRGLGDRTVFQYNVVKNCYDVNDNHDDGFQSWSVGSDGQVGTGAVTGIVLRGNTIINYEDPNQPFRGTLQGIGLFDGMFVDWVIENNVVITDHWHGITLLGARNSRVVNNTVIDPNQTSPGPPWIKIAPHKNGTPAEGCLVRNNLATDIANEGAGIVEDHNVLVDDPLGLFVDPAAYDLHLLPGTALAIDQGSADQAPAHDRDRIPRPQGSGIDVGAYEWHDGSAIPADGGAGEPDAGGTGGTGGTGASGGQPATGGGGSGNLDAGSGSGGTSSAGTGGASAAQSDTGEDGGCGCRVKSDLGARSSVGLLAVAVLFGMRRRRLALGR